MKKFTAFSGLAVPLAKSNVDTDQIIPKQFLKSIKRTGFGVNLFDEWRYLDEGFPGQDASKRPLNPDFVLNLSRYQGAEILVAGENFGCGSSREHAPWAIAEFGIRVILAPSYADIFFNNCFKNALLPIVLPASVIEHLFKAIEAEPGFRLHVDLAAQKIEAPSGETWTFAVDAFNKTCLLEGLDDIELTLKDVEAIKGFEQKHQQAMPWVFS